MIQPIFSSNLNLKQTEDILKELSKLNVIRETGHEIYMASKTITTAPSDYLTQRIRNYLSTWTGWSTNLYYLPVLTKQVVKFMKSEEGQNIHRESVMSAIEGLGVLLFVKGPDDENRPYIDEALDDLLRALGIATFNMEKHAYDNSPGLMNYIWQKSGSFIPYLSVSSVVNLVSEKARYILGYKQENPLFKPAFEKIKQFIFLHTQENDVGFKNTIKSFFHDKKLTAVCTVPVSEHEFIDVPAQFYCDCARFRTITINGKKIFDIKTADISSSKQISVAMTKEFGSPTFQRFGAIVHQSLIADQAVRWLTENWPAEWMEPQSPFQQSFISHAEGFHFTINEIGEKIEIKAKIILKISAAVSEEIIENYQLPKNEDQDIGYLVLDRQVSVKKDELLDDLENLSGEYLLPSLSIKQTVSDFYSTFQEAGNFLNNLK